MADALAGSVPMSVKAKKKRDAGDDDMDILVTNEEEPEDDSAVRVPDVTTTESTTDPPAVIHIQQIHTDVDKNQNQSGTPVTYSANGKTVVSQEDCVVTREDGRRVIISPTLETNTQDRELKESDLKFLRIFSILGIILFFPLGIPSFIYYLKTKREFPIGKQTNDMTKAKHYCKRCERLIIFALISGLLTFAVIFAVVERTVWGHHDYYTHHSMAHHGIG